LVIEVFGCWRARDRIKSKNKIDHLMNKAQK